MFLLAACKPLQPGMQSNGIPNLPDQYIIDLVLKMKQAMQPALVPLHSKLAYLVVMA